MEPIANAEDVIAGPASSPKRPSVSAVEIKRQQKRDFVQGLLELQQVSQPPDPYSLARLESEAQSLWPSDDYTEYVSRDGSSVEMYCACCEKLVRSSAKFPDGHQSFRYACVLIRLLYVVCLVCAKIAFSCTMLNWNDLGSA